MMRGIGKIGFVCAGRQVATFYRANGDAIHRILNVSIHRAAPRRRMVLDDLDVFESPTAKMNAVFSRKFHNASYYNAVRGGSQRK
jgi:hypothetical protein